jgi:Tfp pilus assembly protein PilZ
MLEVRYQQDGATLVHQGRTSDLGLGGAFVESSTSPPIGTRLVVSVVTPTAWERLAIEAEVRWVHDGSDGEPAGFGVRFGTLSGPIATALYELINHSAFE